MFSRNPLRSQDFIIANITLEEINTPKDWFLNHEILRVEILYCVAFIIK